jgi:MraZ protein
MFLGQYRHSLDAKGRLNVPKKFLEPLQDPAHSRLFYATLGLEQCIFFFLYDEWQELVAQVRQASLGSEEARGFSRQFFSMARELPVDGSGRVLIPKEYRELAGLESEAILVGVDRRIELWSPARWDEESKRNQDSYEQHAKEIFRA